MYTFSHDEKYPIKMKKTELYVLKKENGELRIIFST